MILNAEMFSLPLSNIYGVLFKGLDGDDLDRVYRDATERLEQLQGNVRNAPLHRDC